MRRVWPLNIAMAIAAVALAFAPVQTAAPIDLPVTLSWWALVILVAIVEFPSIHLHIRSESHSFSLGELGLCIGLFLVPPAQFVIGAVIGAAIAKLRLPPVKWVFNVAMWGLQAAASLVVFRAVADASNPFGARGVAGAFIAMFVMGAIGVVTVSAAISLASGRIRARPLLTTTMIALPVNVANTGLGLVATYLIIEAPQLVFALVGPTLVFFLAYRAFVVEHQRHDRLKVVYQTTRSVLEAADVSSAVSAVLAQAREVFRADVAQIVLFSERVGDPIPVSTLGPGDSVSQTTTQSLVGTIFSDVAATRRSDRLDGEKLALRGTLIGVDDGSIRDAVVAPLEGERRLVGAMVVANRLGDSGGFDAADVLLLETLAGHAGVAIGNGRLERTLDELKELQGELAERATTDPLTGLANRGHFGACLTDALDRRDGASGVGLIYVDLDDFKGVNDRLGHAAGDHLLHELAVRLRSCLRDGDVPGRLGGDEFAVVIGQVDSVEQLTRLADRIQSAIERPLSWDGSVLEPRVSMGVALAGDETDAASLLADSDTAMYHAKRSGKGQLAMYDPAMRSAQISHENLTRAIGGAVEAGELVLFYQPVIRLADRHVVGVEALVRWNRPGLGLISPADFIPAAEQAGLMGGIGQWVIREACSQVTRWTMSGLVDATFGVSVNISAGQLEDPAFTTRVTEALHASGLEPRALTLEVTEQALADRSTDGRAHLVKLRERGIQVAIDDFGTGLSSLGRLAEQPIDLLKLPGAFLSVGGEGDRPGFAHSLVALGRSLGIPTVVEGIEDAGQADHVVALGADFAQGFHFAAAMPAESFAEWLRTSSSVPLVAPVR